MTLTLEIAPEIEEALVVKARRVGLSLPDYAAGVLARDAASEKPRRHAASFGKFADMGVTTAGIHAARREEVALDERRETGSAQ